MGGCEGQKEQNSTDVWAGQQVTVACTNYNYDFLGQQSLGYSCRGWELNETSLGGSREVNFSIPLLEVSCGRYSYKK